MSGENQDVPYRNSADTPPAPRKVSGRGGRPRSTAVDQAILYAAREELVEHGFTRLRLEHVAARAGVGKATLHPRSAPKGALARALLASLAAPPTPVAGPGNTRAELHECVQHALEALRDTPFGGAIRALL